MWTENSSDTSHVTINMKFLEPHWLSADSMSVSCIICTHCFRPAVGDWVFFLVDLKDSSIITKSKARFRRRSFHEPNLIDWIKYMKSLASESIKNGYFNLERLSRSFCLASLAGISLWFRSRTFHKPILMHKLLWHILQNRWHFELFWFKVN